MLRILASVALLGLSMVFLLAVASDVTWVELWGISVLSFLSGGLLWSVFE